MAPWQDQKWLADARRSMRPNQFLRMVENRFVGSELSFINMDLWDACVDPQLGHRLADHALPVWGAIDASIKHDSTALVLTSWDQTNQRVMLCDHRIFVPSAGNPINFSEAVEQTILDWQQRFSLQAVWYDPYQMVASAQALTRHGVNMVEYPQTLPNLTAMAENLFTLIKNRNLTVYADEQTGTAVSRTIAVEGSRGWKLDKAKQSHRIDICVALAMAALAATKAQSDAYDYSGNWVSGPPDQQPEQQRTAYAEALDRYVSGMINLRSMGGRRW